MTETASEKLYYKIGEVAEMLSINTSVLRFWESQFDVLSPSKTRTGQRLYSLRDFDQIKEIYRLLYVQKLTIAGARARLSLKKREKNSAESEPAELPHARGGAGGDDEIAGMGLLQHPPHHVDIISRESPVALRIEVAKRESPGPAEFDPRHPVGDLARDELDAPQGGLVIEEDAA